MGTVFKISLLSITVGICTACHSVGKPRITNTHYRGFTSQEIEQQAATIKAQLIAKKELEQSTVLVYGNHNRFWYGTHYTRVDQYSDGQIRDMPEYRSLAAVEFDAFKQATAFTVDQSLSSPDFSYRHDYILAVIHSPELLADVDSVQFVFNDKTFETVSLNGRKALIYPYDAKNRPCCQQVDFLSASGKVLHSRAKDQQIFP